MLLPPGRRRLPGLVLLVLVLLIRGVRCEDADEDASTKPPAPELEPTASTARPGEDGAAEQIALGERKLGDQIRAILKHYQQEDPIGMPGVPVPDPMPVPDMRQDFPLFTMDLSQIQVFGLSRFRIEGLRSEIAHMQVDVSLSIEVLDIRGKYVLSTWLSSSNGDFTVKLSGVKVQGLAGLEVGINGKLHAQDIDMDLTFDTIDMDFQNLGFMASVFQSVVNSVGSFIFESIKPYILKEVNTNIRGEVNKHISALPNYFPNSISPFDMAVAEARKQVSNMGYDPFMVKDHSQSMGIITITSSHTWVTGLASFYRMGNITLSMENGKVYAVMDIGTQEIEGRTQWDVSTLSGWVSRTGTIKFTIEYFRVKLNVSQPLDTRKRATLEELDFELGNLQIRFNGAGTIDYLIEAGVNVVPNLLRNQIMDALEGPIRRRIQDEIDKVDVEKLIHEKIPEIEERAKQLQEAKPVDDELLDGSTTERPSFLDEEEDEEEELPNPETQDEEDDKLPSFSSDDY